MSLQVIPLNSAPNQSFTVQLNVDDKPLSLNVNLSYNEMASYWILAILDIANNLLVDSVPMLTGSYPAGNLLEQQRYLNIGAWYVVNVSNVILNSPLESGASAGYGGGNYGSGGFGGDEGMSGYDWPNDTNLGTDYQLWVDDTPFA